MCLYVSFYYSFQTCPPSNDIFFYVLKILQFSRLQKFQNNNKPNFLVNPTTDTLIVVKSAYFEFYFLLNFACQNNKTIVGIFIFFCLAF